MSDDGLKHFFHVFVYNCKKNEFVKTLGLTSNWEQAQSLREESTHDVDKEGFINVVYILGGTVLPIAVKDAIKMTRHTMSLIKADVLKDFRGCGFKGSLWFKYNEPFLQAFTTPTREFTKVVLT